MVQGEERQNITTTIEEVGSVDTATWNTFITDLEQVCRQCESYYAYNEGNEEESFGVLDSSRLKMHIRIDELSPKAIKIINKYTKVDLEKLIEERNKMSSSYMYTTSEAYHIMLSKDEELSELRIGYNGIRLNNQEVQQQINELCGEKFMLTGVSKGYKNIVYELSYMPAGTRRIGIDTVRYQMHQDNETGKINRVVGVFEALDELKNMVIDSEEILPLAKVLTLEEKYGKQLQDEIEQIARGEKSEVKTQIPMGEYKLTKVGGDYDIIKFEMILPNE